MTTTDLDLLSYFGGTWGATCPWPSHAEIEEDLRSFYSGENPRREQQSRQQAGRELANLSTKPVLVA